MKKNVLLLFALAILHTTLIGQEVPNTQTSLIIKKSATWCPPCGGWGWDLFDNLIIDNQQDAILWAVHYSGDLANQTAEDIDNNNPAGSQPRFYVDLVDIDASSSSAAAKRVEVQNMVAQNAATDPLANAVVTTSSISGNQLNVTVKTKFFQEGTGTYHLNVYVVENEIISYQAGQGNSAVHEKILRADMGNSAFGDAINSATVPMDTEMTHSFSIDISNWNQDHIELSTILWEFNGSNYEFVNGTSLKSIVLANHQPELTAATFSVLGNPIHELSRIQLDIHDAFFGNLDIIDGNGKQVLLLASQNFQPGKQLFDMPRLAASGLYFIRLSNDQGQIVKKILTSY